jgi:DNA-directed RNA polymerase specialized sigma24 family protein
MWQSGSTQQEGLSTHSVTNALYGCREGDPNAQFALASLLCEFLNEQIRWVRKNRGTRFQSIIDSHAVVNEGLNRLLTKLENGGFTDIRNRSDLRGKLVVIIRYVLLDARRLYSNGCRDRQREVHDDELLHQLASKPLPDPGEDFLEELKESLREVHEGAMMILELLLDGWTSLEIAQKLGLGLRNVQRIIARMRKACDELFASRLKGESC